MIFKTLLIIVIVAFALAEESESYTRTKIKNRCRVQVDHPGMFKDSQYNYVDDSDVKYSDSKFGNIKIDDPKTKKVYNYIDIKKHIRTNKSFEAGNVKIGKKGQVKGVYNYTHIKGVHSKGSADIGNLDIDQKRINGKFNTHIEADKIDVR